MALPPKFAGHDMVALSAEQQAHTLELCELHQIVTVSRPSIDWEIYHRGRSRLRLSGSLVPSMMRDACIMSTHSVVGVYVQGDL